MHRHDRVMRTEVRGESGRYQMDKAIRVGTAIPRTEVQNASIRGMVGHHVSVYIVYAYRMTKSYVWYVTTHRSAGCKHPW